MKLATGAFATPASGTGYADRQRWVHLLRAERDTVLALAGATRRAEVIEASLSGMLALDPQVTAATMLISAGTRLQVAGAVGAVSPASQGHQTDVADLPPVVAQAWQGGGLLVTGAPAADLAVSLRLLPHATLILAPLSVRDAPIGFLIAAMDLSPHPDTWTAALRLGRHAGLALDVQRSTERLRTMVDHSLDLLFLASESGAVRLSNPAAQVALGLTEAELNGRDLRSLIHPDDLATVFPAGTGPVGQTARPCRLGRSDGTWVQVEMSIGAKLNDDGTSSLVVTARDVSDRHQLEIELRHAQKLESVGRLAAGIAHEINTPIQFIGDNVRFLGDAFDDLMRLHHARDSADGTADGTSDAAGRAAAQARVRAARDAVDLDFIVEEVPAAIRQTLDGVGRVATIVRAMKAFGYTNQEDMTPVDINEAIRNTLVVATSELKYAADVHTDLADLPPVRCYAGDVNQVILNLVINAAHAIGSADRGRGTITVTTRRDGDHVTVSVTDTGTGITPDVAEKMFEPFFTTKPVGTGTGQGLALVQSLVVSRHGGAVSVRTAVGSGSTFTVRLPIEPPAAGGSPTPGVPA